MLLGLLQELGQRRDIQVTKSSAGQPSCDFLQQPSIPVRIAKRGERAVGGMLGCWPTNATAAVDLELSAWHPGVKHITDPNTVSGKISARSLNIGDNQIEALSRSRRCRCN